MSTTGSSTPIAGTPPSGWPAQDRGGRPRAMTTALVAAAVAAVAWVLTGLVSGLVDSMGLGSFGAVRRLIPTGMVLVPGGRLRLEVMAFVGLVVLVLVVLGLVLAAARGQVPGHGRLALFFSGWFAAVAASSVATVVQALPYMRGMDIENALQGFLVPVLVSSGYWGLLLGWLVGVAAVLVPARRPVADVPQA